MPAKSGARRPERASRGRPLKFLIMALLPARWLKDRAGLTVVLLLGWGLAGCQAPPASTTNLGSVQRLPTIYVLDKPRKLLEGPTYPMPDTRHILRWRAKRFEWETTLAGNPMSYADVILRQPLDLRAYRPMSFLRFRVRPDFVARDLYVGLMDSGHDGSPPVMVRLPMAAYRVWRRNAQGYYVIPLKDFSLRGEVLSEDDRRVPAGSGGRMDWGQVSGFRIGTLTGQANRQPFLITHLQIGSNVQVREKEEPPLNPGSRRAPRRGAAP